MIASISYAKKKAGFDPAFLFQQNIYLSITVLTPWYRNAVRRYKPE